MARISRVILAKGIKMDKAYKQTLSYSESDLLTLLTDSSHLVSSKSNYSFVRERGSIKLQETYATCLKANYMAFQNTDYSGKWFFCFIDKVVYINENTTEIYYTVDVWSTWFDYWNPKTCYIIRQHATSDGVGENTVPEGLEHGEYVLNVGHQVNESKFTQYAYILVSSEYLPNDNPSSSHKKYISMGGAVMNGVVRCLASPDEVSDFVSAIVSQTSPENNVLYVYMIPLDLIIQSHFENPTTGLLKSWTTPFNYDRKIMSRPTSLDGYTPVNKKLLTYPYQYCLMQNNAGASNILYYEHSGYINGTSLDNVERGAIYIQYFGVPTIGASVIAIPKWYKNSALKLDESLSLGKFPTLGWSEDAYINWLTQNSVNHTTSNIRTGAELVGGIGALAGGIALTASGVGAGIGASMITGGAGMLMSGGVDAVNTAVEYYEHSKEPDSYKGQLNSGDILTCIGANSMSYTGMCIKEEWARKLDKFFTRFGYKQNAVLYPNLSHRANYNYIQISKDSTACYVNNHNNICVPAPDLESINNIFRNGVTVWNNHTNMGDYSVANGITS